MSTPYSVYSYNQFTIEMYRSEDPVTGQYSYRAESPLPNQRLQTEERESWGEAEIEMEKMLDQQCSSKR